MGRRCYSAGILNNDDDKWIHESLYLCVYCDKMVHQGVFYLHIRECDERKKRIKENNLDGCQKIAEIALYFFGYVTYTRPHPQDIRNSAAIIDEGFDPKTLNQINYWKQRGINFNEDNLESAYAKRLIIVIDYIKDVGELPLEYIRRNFSIPVMDELRNKYQYLYGENIEILYDMYAKIDHLINRYLWTFPMPQHRLLLSAPLIEDGIFY